MYKSTITVSFLLILLITFANHSLFSQEIVFEKTIRLKSGLTNKRQVMPIVTDDNTTLILIGKKEITASVLNQNFEEIASYKMPRAKVDFLRLLGYSVQNNDYHLFFTNDTKDQFFIQTINVTDQQNRSEVSDLELRGEIYLESFSYHNKFYLLTLINKTSILKVYAFDGNDIAKETEFDFSDYQLNDGTYFDLYDALFDVPQGFSQSRAITKVAVGNPNPLEIAAEPIKLYYFNDQLFLSFDHLLNETQLITIDLLSDKFLFESITHEEIICGNTLESSNSFLSEDILFQVRACKNGLKMQAKDLVSKQILSAYEVGENEEILFKNGAVKQEGGTNAITQDTERTLDDTDKILRKIGKSMVGISAHRSNGRVTLRVGGYKEYNYNNTGGGFDFAGSGMAANTGGFTAAPLFSFNPVMGGYANYKSTRSVHFHSILDEKLYLHQEGSVSINAFDKIRDFESKTLDYITTKTVFKVNDDYLFGYYDNTKWVYKLRRFTN